MMPWFLSLVLCWTYIYICPQDDILPKLMTSTGSYEDLFRKEISKYDHICEDIAQNIEAQEQLLLQIQVYFLFNLSWTFIYMFLQYHFFYPFWIFKRARFKVQFPLTSWRRSYERTHTHTHPPNHTHTHTHTLSFWIVETDVSD